MLNKIVKTPLSDVFLINHFEAKDKRGIFIKQYSNNFTGNSHLDFVAEESFTTISKKNVIRGMHCQTGKASHKKLITCIKGSIIDVIVDIRKDSSQFNKPFSIKLEDKKQQSIFIGIGYAHGFLCLEENTIIQYITSKKYKSNLDNGVKWKSIDFEWPTTNPITSDRDNSLPDINDQEFEFKY
tara:strand:- start:723 stop:1271 length:549 start_codon:yes stop_codon:yes gene_type:complete